MPKVKKETVSVSFHILERSKKPRDPLSSVKFLQREFDSLFENMTKKPKFDVEDEEAADRLRSRLEVPLEQVEKVDQRTIYGLFRASYWGHSFDNTAKGVIPADSISLRPFYFLLYLSEKGRIYICTQYLGQFGGYNGLRTTLCDLLPRPTEIAASSFRLNASYYKDAEPREVRVKVSTRSKTISSGNVFTDSGVIAFKKRDRYDDFEKQVSNKMLSLLGRPQKDIKGAIAEILRQGQLIEVSDDEIEDCSIVASVNGKNKVIYLLEDNNFASRLPIDVPLNRDGHPGREETKTEMLRLLKNDVISVKEDV